MAAALNSKAMLSLVQFGEVISISCTTSTFFTSLPPTIRTCFSLLTKAVLPKREANNFLVVSPLLKDTKGSTECVKREHQ